VRRGHELGVWDGEVADMLGLEGHMFEGMLLLIDSFLNEYYVKRVS
jgi:hypothetical protein